MLEDRGVERWRIDDLNTLTSERVLVNLVTRFAGIERIERGFRDAVLVVDRARLRDLRGVIDREQAAIGILISLQEATGPMETEAASVGFYEHKTNKLKFPRLQPRTVKELMDGKGIERPTSAASLDDTFKKAPESKKKGTEQTELGV